MPVKSDTLICADLLSCTRLGALAPQGEILSSSAPCSANILRTLLLFVEEPLLVVGAGLILSEC